MQYGRSEGTGINYVLSSLLGRGSADVLTCAGPPSGCMGVVSRITAWTEAMWPSLPFLCRPRYAAYGRLHLDKGEGACVGTEPRRHARARKTQPGPGNYLEAFDGFSLLRKIKKDARRLCKNGILVHRRKLPNIGILFVHAMLCKTPSLSSPLQYDIHGSFVNFMRRCCLGSRAPRPCVCLLPWLR